VLDIVAAEDRAVGLDRIVALNLAVVVDKAPVGKPVGVRMLFVLDVQTAL